MINNKNIQDIKKTRKDKRIEIHEKLHKKYVKKTRDIEKKEKGGTNLKNKKQMLNCDVWS